MTLTPVWFLDVDGVINSVGQPKPKHGRHELVDVQTSNGRSYGIRYFPHLIARINDLHHSGLVDVVWLTTWNDDAPQRLAPAVGLDDFPVLPDPQRPDWTSHPYAHDRTWWKYGLVLEHLAATPDRPVVWTDDDLDRRTKNDLRARHRGPAKLITPMPVPGLVDEHLDFIEAFCLTNAPHERSTT